MNYFMGIDPGYASGAICLMPENLDPDEIHVVELKDSSWGDWKTIANFLEDFDKSLIRYAVLEQVHSSPRQGVRNAFKFGQGYGAFWFWLMYMGFEYEYAPPQKWQSFSHLAGKKIINSMPREDRKITRAKEFTLRYVRAKFPELGRISHNVADAVCIALYARRVWRGRLPR